LFRKRNIKMFLILIALSVMMCACNNVKKEVINTNTNLVSNTKDSLETYIDKKFKFSVDFPSYWDYEIEKTWEATSTQEGSPDGGINIYIDGNKNDRIRIYGQYGHISIPVDEYKMEDFSTTSGLTGTLLKQNIGDEIIIQLVLNDNLAIGGFHGANIKTSQKCYQLNEKQVMNVLKSINILDSKSN